MSRDGRTRTIGLVRCTVRGTLDHAVLELSGELDFSIADRVRAVVAALPDRIIRIDLSGLQFIDCAGARAVHLIMGDRAAQGARPELVGCSREVLRTMELARIGGQRDAVIAVT